MKRCAKRSSAIAVAVAVAALAACAPSVDPATYRVEHRPFRHLLTVEGELQAADVTQLTVPNEVQSSVRLAWLAPEGARLEAGDLVALFDARGFEERLDQGRNELATAELEAEKADTESALELGQLDTRLEVAELELEVSKRFQKTDSDVFSRQEIVESQIDEKLAVERKRHASGARRNQEDRGRADLDLLDIKKRQARQTLEQARRGLQALEVRAPHAGVLALARDWRGNPREIGQELWRGQDVAEIPDLSKLEARVFVLEADAGGLAEGKPARVVVEADPGRVYEARTRAIDKIAQPRFRGSPVQYFGVDLELLEQDAEAMKPGQRVQATLILEDLDDALVVPRQAVVHENGEARVWVLENGRLEPRPVEVGSSSLGTVVVSSGLVAGERVALRPPGGETPSRDTEPAAPRLAGNGRSAG